MLLAAALTHPVLACTPTTLGEITSVEGPAIVVLGERHGNRRDLRRATRIVKSLARDRQVTVAMEAVAEARQEVMDRLEQGELSARQVKEAADWAQTWGHRFAAYRPLLAVDGVDFVAAGPLLGEALDDDVQVPVPEAYDDKLRPVAEAHGMSPEDIPGFSRKMAWRDLKIASLAVEGWSGRGILVVVAGRGHVAEGLGITWQLDQGLAEVPWSSALLGPPDDACGVDDRYLP